MSNEIYEFEISRNREGDLLATAGVKGDSSSYRIAGPKAWGGSSRVASIEITQRDMVEFIRCYAPGALADLATPSPANGAVGEMPELPEPFFYYEANSDESVAWNEGCVCVDDVYTNDSEYAAENETHGGKVFSVAQMQAYARAAVLAERAACSIINFRAIVGLSHDQCIEVMQAIRART